MLVVFYVCPGPRSCNGDRRLELRRPAWHRMGVIVAALAKISALLLLARTHCCLHFLTIPLPAHAHPVSTLANTHTKTAHRGAAHGQEPQRAADGRNARDGCRSDQPVVYGEILASCGPACQNSAQTCHGGPRSRVRDREGYRPLPAGACTTLLQLWTDPAHICAKRATP